MLENVLHVFILLFAQSGNGFQIETFQLRVGIVGNCIENLIVGRNGNHRTANIELYGFHFFSFPVVNEELVAWSPEKFIPFMIVSFGMSPEYNTYTNCSVA